MGRDYKELSKRVVMEAKGGFDWWFFSLLLLALVAFEFGVPFCVLGFISIDKADMAVLAYVGCGLIPFSLFLVVFVLVRRKIQIKKYKSSYDIWKSKSRKERWKWLFSGEEQNEGSSDSSMTRALTEAAKRAAWGHGSSSYTPSSSSSSTPVTRVNLKDGKTLHTEERVGDYKTYLYDEDGKNTGLHLSGDKVYDDSWHEVGSFDSSGKFTPKD